MKYYTYVLKSKTNGRSYVGHTQDLDRRLIEHNSGKNLFTRHKGPWLLVHKEAFPTRTEAIKREKYFKTVAGRIELKRRELI